MNPDLLMGESTIMGLKNVSEQCCPVYINYPISFLLLFVIALLAGLLYQSVSIGKEPVKSVVVTTGPSGSTCDHLLMLVGAPCLQNLLPPKKKYLATLKKSTSRTDL